MTIDQSIQRDLSLVQAISSIPAMLDIICRTTGMGYATVARVTNDRWVACAVKDNINFGLGVGGELKVDTTLCHEVHQFGEPIVIDNVPEDKDYAGHPTPAMYGLKSYIAVPIFLKDGRFFGTLCAIDPSPAKIKNEETIGMFKLYAELIATHLDNFEAVELTKNKLVEEQEIAALREEFIAVLGHDLRNPVGAIKNVGQLMTKGLLNERSAERFGTMLLNSSVRITGLIDNLMDFAQGRLGGGISIYPQSTLIGHTLNHVIDELQLTHPEAIIETNLNCEQEVFVDGKRIAQLFSNLLGNALNHGDKGKPITIDARTDTKGINLCVSNYCAPLPDETMHTIFQPYKRGVQNGKPEGLGLGLYISAEIARAHGGKLTANYQNGQIRFCLDINAV